MSWNSGGGLTLSGAAQQLPNPVGLVKALRIYQWPTNTHAIFSGDSNALDPTAAPPVGVTGWAPAPGTGSQAPYIDAYETNSMNGINSNQVFVSGTAGEYITWSYIVQ